MVKRKAKITKSVETLNQREKWAEKGLLCQCVGLTPLFFLSGEEDFMKRMKGNAK